MIRPRVTVLELMALVLFFAIIFGAFSLYRENGVRDSDSAYGTYLVVLLGSTFGARSSRLLAPFFRGVAIYGWLYLVVALHFGMGVTDSFEASQQFTRKCIVAAPMGALCGLLSWYFGGAVPIRKKEDAAKA